MTPTEALVLLNDFFAQTGLQGSIFINEPHLFEAVRVIRKAASTCADDGARLSMVAYIDERKIAITLERTNAGAYVLMSEKKIQMNIQEFNVMATMVARAQQAHLVVEIGGLGITTTPEVTQRGDIYVANWEADGVQYQMTSRKNNTTTLLRCEDGVWVMVAGVTFV